MFNIAWMGWGGVGGNKYEKFTVTQTTLFPDLLRHSEINELMVRVEYFLLEHFYVLSLKVLLITTSNVKTNWKKFFFCNKCWHKNNNQGKLMLWTKYSGRVLQIHSCSSRGQLWKPPPIRDVRSTTGKLVLFLGQNCVCASFEAFYKFASNEYFFHVCGLYIVSGGPDVSVNEAVDIYMKIRLPMYYGFL